MAILRFNLEEWTQLQQHLFMRCGLPFHHPILQIDICIIPKSESPTDCQGSSTFECEEPHRPNTWIGQDHFLLVGKPSYDCPIVQMFRSDAYTLRYSSSIYNK